MKVLSKTMLTDRKLAYQLEVTVIKGEGNLYIQKKGLHGDAHIKEILNGAGLLKMIYDEAVNIPTLLEDKIIMPFTHGNSLLQIAKNDGLEEALYVYFPFLEINDNLCKFQMTRKFKAVFGDVEIPEDIPALKVADLDLNLTNTVITQDGDFVLNDFEWILDFPVPVDYIKYRAVLDLLNKGSTSGRVPLMEKFGISLNSEVLERMEMNFDNYIKNADIEAVPLYKKDEQEGTRAKRTGYDERDSEIARLESMNLLLRNEITKLNAERQEIIKMKIEADLKLDEMTNELKENEELLNQKSETEKMRNREISGLKAELEAKNAELENERINSLRLIEELNSSNESFEKKCVELKTIMDAYEEKCRDLDKIKKIINDAI